MRVRREAGPAFPPVSGLAIVCGQLGLSPLPFGKHRAALTGPRPRLRVGDSSALLCPDPPPWGLASFPPAGASWPRSARRLSLRCHWDRWRNGTSTGVALPRCCLTRPSPVPPAGRAPPPPWGGRQARTFKHPPTIKSRGRDPLRAGIGISESGAMEGAYRGRSSVHTAICAYAPRPRRLRWVSRLRERVLGG